MAHAVLRDSFVAEIVAQEVPRESFSKKMWRRDLKDSFSEKLWRGVLRDSFFTNIVGAGGSEKQFVLAQDSEGYFFHKYGGRRRF